jgi:hypothetical protein
MESEQAKRINSLDRTTGRRSRNRSVPDEVLGSGVHGHSRTTPQALRPSLTHVSRVEEETRQGRGHWFDPR